MFLLVVFPLYVCSFSSFLFLSVGPGFAFAATFLLLALLCRGPCAAVANGLGIERGTFGVSQGMGRARDDLDMERALRPRINAPDVVRSTLSHKELKYNESTIDQLLGTPNKIVIPERYIPEQVKYHQQY